MKRLDVLMPSRNSYSDVMLGWPSSMIDGLGGRAAHVEHDEVAVAARARPSRAAPTTPPAGPEATTNTGFSLAARAPIMPPLEVMTRIGAVTPMRAGSLSSCDR